MQGGRRNIAGPELASPQALASRRSGGLFQLRLPFSLRGQPVHVGAMVEGCLACRHVLRLAAPCLLCRRLKRAAVGEGEFPRMRTDGVDGVQVFGRLLLGLTTREECDAGHGCRHDLAEQPYRLFGDFLPEITMLGLRMVPSSFTRAAWSSP